MVRAFVKVRERMEDKLLKAPDAALIPRRTKITRGNLSERVKARFVVVKLPCPGKKSSFGKGNF